MFYREMAIALVGWFEKNARQLPWRERYDPYHVYISEIMLQQTQMDTVVPYFLRWIDRYPTLQSLAIAEEAEALKLWEGLGYYSRCRNVLRCARELIKDGYSTLPNEAMILLGYPGIGPYTAGAIASIAYDQRVPAVDGNVERVVSRLFDLSDPLGSRALKDCVRQRVQEMIQEVSPRLLNQALMELGALVCIPSKAKCERCPLCTWCTSLQKGIVSLRPVPKPRVPIENVPAVGVIVRYEEMFLLRKRSEGGLWSGFWEVPWFRAESDIVTQVRTWVDSFFPVEKTMTIQARSVRFAFTKYRVLAQVIVVDLETMPDLGQLKPEEWGAFLPLELASLTLSSGSRRFLKVSSS